jgi:hypothetical protein
LTGINNSTYGKTGLNCDGICAYGGANYGRIGDKFGVDG